MPQLDALTYFSQYVVLIITFGGVYSFVIQFILPESASSLKLKCKLNSSNILKQKLVTTSTIPIATVDLVESNIAYGSWYSTISVYGSLCLVQTGMWLVSVSTMQLMECIDAKKKLCYDLLIPFRA